MPDPTTELKDLVSWEPSDWTARWQQALATHQRPHHRSASSDGPTIRERTSWGWLFWTHPDIATLAHSLATGTELVGVEPFAIAVVNPARRRPVGTLTRMNTVHLPRIRKCRLTGRLNPRLLHKIVTADHVAHLAHRVSSPCPVAVSEANILAHHALWEAAHVGATGGQGYGALEILTGLDMLHQQLAELVELAVIPLAESPAVHAHRPERRSLTRTAFIAAVEQLAGLRRPNGGPDAARNHRS